MDDSVRVEGTMAFTSLPGDAYAYRVEYEQSEGRVWLRSRKTDREWCVFPPHSLNCVTWLHVAYIMSYRVVQATSVGYNGT